MERKSTGCNPPQSSPPVLQTRLNRRAPSGEIPSDWDLEWQLFVPRIGIYPRTGKRGIVRCEKKIEREAKKPEENAVLKLNQCANKSGRYECELSSEQKKCFVRVASALLAFANFVKSQDSARNLYSSRYDNLDIDTILGSNRLVNNYVDCLLSRKPCPPEGKDLKRILPEALRTKCARCSVTQKENALKIITTLYYSYPDQYMALRERWDPSGEYHRRFEEYLQGIQFNQIGSNGNDRPVRNDFDRDQSQVLLQTLILSSTTVAPSSPPQPQPQSPNALPNGPEQRPQQLAPSAQLTQPAEATKKLE
ncbi:AAEL001957-PA [Aedes aegypti]|uniref:AAEL001957-PA n=1 Tax=Aedes aegypti TaxID=7159 RepID=Q17JL0_AEDAE|nr:AAEL001957-PA [Aedes aegypti]